MGPSDRDAGDRRWGNDGAVRRYPADFQPVPSHAARARKKLPSLNRRNDHAALIRLGLPERPDAGRGLCRSNRRLPLYGVSPADTGAVPTSAGQVGCMATDGSRLPMLIDQPARSAMARVTGRHTMRPEPSSASRSSWFARIQSERRLSALRTLANRTVISFCRATVRHR